VTSCEVTEAAPTTPEDRKFGLFVANGELDIGREQLGQSGGSH
jgi:hypothetical protein